MPKRTYHDSLIRVVHHSNQHVYCYEGGTDSIGDKENTTKHSGKGKRRVSYF